MLQKRKILKLGKYCWVVQFRQQYKDYDDFEEKRSELNCFQSEWNLIFVKKLRKEKESHQRQNFKETSVDTSPLNKCPSINAGNILNCCLILL